MSRSAGLACHDTIRVVMTDGGLSLNALAIIKPRILPVVGSTPSLTLTWLADETREASPISKTRFGDSR